MCPESGCNCLYLLSLYYFSILVSEDDHLAHTILYIVLHVPFDLLLLVL